MTAMEWIVLAVGLLVGYWLVMALIGGAPPAAGRETAAEAAPPAAPRGGGLAVQPWHLVLEVAPDAGADAIQAAHDRLMAQYAPDRVADLGPELREVAARRSREIADAYREAMRARVSSEG